MSSNLMTCRRLEPRVSSRPAAYLVSQARESLPQSGAHTSPNASQALSSEHDGGRTKSRGSLLDLRRWLTYCDDARGRHATISPAEAAVSAPTRLGPHRCSAERYDDRTAVNVVGGVKTWSPYTKCVMNQSVAS
jgi:hypothetical protein